MTMRAAVSEADDSASRGLLKLPRKGLAPLREGTGK